MVWYNRAMKDPNEHSDPDLWLDDQERFERLDDYNAYEEQQILDDREGYDDADDFPFDLDVLQ